ncbi:hypothetical protein INR49_032947 [Caranx melampygus]|nr:hypothetical protein INR49_032947 [Caranx melampygus]
MVTGGCCLFLAGKVEETPKKCKDIIKTARSLLNDTQFAQFGDDPKEEVMVLERILLQTIKFDLQVEHPYQFLLRYAKQLKGDKNKVQKLVQMAWTFVNDSLCTMVALQWEPQIIAVAVMYLAGRLCKFDIQDWTSRQLSRRWWEQFVYDVPVEVLEDICHQILDLYSQAKQQMPDGGMGTVENPHHLPSCPPQLLCQSKRSHLRPAPGRPDQLRSSTFFLLPTGPRSPLQSGPPTSTPLPSSATSPTHRPPQLQLLVSSDGYQKLQSMMKTEGSCYTTVPQACVAPLGYHQYPQAPHPTTHPPSQPTATCLRLHLLRSWGWRLVLAVGTHHHRP